MGEKTTEDITSSGNLKFLEDAKLNPVWLNIPVITQISHTYVRIQTYVRDYAIKSIKMVLWIIEGFAGGKLVRKDFWAMALYDISNDHSDRTDALRDWRDLAMKVGAQTEESFVQNQHIQEYMLEVKFIYIEIYILNKICNNYKGKVS